MKTKKLITLILEILNNQSRTANKRLYLNRLQFGGATPNKMFSAQDIYLYCFRKTDAIAFFYARKNHINVIIKKPRQKFS